MIRMMICLSAFACSAPVYCMENVENSTPSPRSKELKAVLECLPNGQSADTPSVQSESDQELDRILIDLQHEEDEHNRITYTCPNPKRSRWIKRKKLQKINKLKERTAN